MESFFRGVNFVPSSSGDLSIHNSRFSDNGESGVEFDSPGNAYIRNSLADGGYTGFEVDLGNVIIEDSAAIANSDFGIYLGEGSLSLIHDEVAQNKYGIGSDVGNLQFAYCDIVQNTAFAIVVNNGLITGSNPGTSVVSGSIANGSLGTAATLK